MSGTLPAGTLMAIGGPAASTSHWLLCDGRPYAMATGPYSNLGGVIAANFGGDGINVFNVPDLRGRFLRGTSHGVQTDPDRASRFALSQGGAIGDQTGSAQWFATAGPQKPFVIGNSGVHTHNLANVPLTDHHAAYGASGPAAYYTMDWSSQVVQTSSDGLHGHATLGGDDETRPSNIYVNWLIAANDLPDAPPIGSIVPFGGDMTNIGVRTAVNQAGWFLCNGDKLQIHITAFQPLYDVIGGLYGGDQLNFQLPDLRGYFVMGAGGKRKVAAIQPYATRSPRNVSFVTDTAADHTHTIGMVPYSTHTIDVVLGWDLAENNPNKSPTSTCDAHTHAMSGGDAESRPINVYVDYIIRYQ
jgi:microcystin-dependent protein